MRSGIRVDEQGISNPALTVDLPWSEIGALTFAPSMALIGDGLPMDAGADEHFSHAVTFVQKGRRAAAIAERRKELFGNRKQQALQEPMSLAQAALVLAGYFVLIGLLLIALVSVADVPGAGEPLRFLE